MNLWMVLGIGGVLLAIIAHIYALAVSRGTRSIAATIAFWSGVVGLLSVPVALVLLIAAMPFFVTGPPHWLDQSINISWSVLAILPVISLATAVLAARKRNWPN